MELTFPLTRKLPQKLPALLAGTKGAKIPEFLIDILGMPAEAAFSVQRRETSYTGPLLRVRRSSDGTEQDVPFAASGKMDLFALMSFVGAENLITVSTDFSDLSWGKTNCAVLTNALEAPDGTLTAAKLYGTGGTVSHYLTKGVTLTGVGKESIYAKPGEWNVLSLSNGPNNWVHFHLSGAGTFSAGTGWDSCSIEYDADTGWYRCAAGSTTQAVAWSSVYVFAGNDSNVSNAISPSTTPSNGTDGLYIWGPQLHASTTLLDYCPTGVGAATSGDGFVSKWYDQSHNVRDAVQATAAAQPKLVVAGKVNRQNGQPVLVSDGTQFLSTAAFSVPVPWTRYSLCRFDDAANAGFPTVLGNLTPDVEQTLYVHSNALLDHGPSGLDVQIFTQLNTGDVAMIGEFLKSPGAYGRFNAISNSTIDPGQAAINGLTLFGAYNAAGAACALGEVLVFGRELLAGEIAILEGDMNTFWAPAQATTPAATRDPLLQPFASTSIWNMPIGDGAVYGPANLDGYPTDPNNSTNTIWAPMPSADHERIILEAAAPLTNVNYSSAGWSGSSRCSATGGLLFTAPIPADYVVASSRKNDCAAILAADGTTVIQCQPLARCTAGADATVLVRFTDVDLYGDGITGSHGGSGLSALGGTIRLGELRPGQQGPKHALKVELYCKQYLYKATTKAESYRWPATTSDGYWNNSSTGYGMGSNAVNNANPDMVMGALLAIPVSTDITALGLETEPALQLAWTLQNYGAYIVDDTASPAFCFCLENGSAGAKTDEFQTDYGFAFEQRINGNTPWTRDIVRLQQALRVVTNNTSGTIGGGGTPLRPLAPAI